MLKTLTRLAGKAAPTAIALVLMAGFAHATVPDSSGVIHGCYNKSGGALRVIDTAKPAQHCTAKQTALSWSGSAIVARPRWTGSDLLFSDHAQHYVTTLSPSWTQGATEVDELLPGSVTMTIDAGCQLNGVTLHLTVQGYDSQYSVDFTPPNLPSSDSNETVTLPLAPYLSGNLNNLMLFEPGAPTSRSLAVDAYGKAICSPGLQVTIDAFSFDVEAIR